LYFITLQPASFPPFGFSAGPLPPGLTFYDINQLAVRSVFRFNLSGRSVKLFCFIPLPFGFGWASTLQFPECAMQLLALYTIAPFFRLAFPVSSGLLLLLTQPQKERLVFFDN
jgi:hypothetical protein